MCQKVPTQPFITYEKQIENLKAKGLTIRDDNQAIEILKKTSYYSLINAYKQVFKNNDTNKYYENAEFMDIYNLYQFDASLRILLLEFILKIERKLKSVYSYAFCQCYGENEAEYLNVTNYNYEVEKFQPKINRLVNTLQEEKNDVNKPYIKHSLDTHGNVPLWVLVNSLTLGNMSVAYECSNHHLQYLVSQEFGPCVNSGVFISMLQMLTKFRNVCAHNERTYCYTTVKELKNLPIHKTILQVDVGKTDIFALCICFKYLLDATEFKAFIDKFKGILNEHLNKIHHEFRSKIMNRMGLREDWYEILSRDVSSNKILVTATTH